MIDKLSQKENALYASDASTNGHAIQIAQLVDEFSKENCSGGVMDRNDCRWYHGSWKFLKILGLVSCPEWHLEFYTSNIIQIIRSINHRPTILICGAADDGTLGVVERALRGLREDSSITVIDMCMTPLFAVQLHAKESDSFTSEARSVVPFLPFRSECLDIIITDAFLTRFMPSERPPIIAEWHRLLRPGGIVLTTTRLQKECESTVVAGEEARKNYTELVRQLSREQGLNIEEMVIRSELYSAKMTSHPFCSVEELEALFDGFSLTISLPEQEFMEIVPRKYARIKACKKSQ